MGRSIFGPADLNRKRENSLESEEVNRSRKHHVGEDFYDKDSVAGFGP
jgi:hypothetical protein